jgi:hypothetical protein
LIGAVDENEVPGSGTYVIGASGVALIQSYLRQKPQNADAHEIEVIANLDLETTYGQKWPSQIIREKRGIITGLSQALQRDFLACGLAGELNKTYLVETFGSTGGNHFVALTVRRNCDEIAPLVELFDPSPGLMRGGLTVYQNAFAAGWAAAISINASVTDAFAALSARGLPLELRQENFFQNLEPMQIGGGSNCSIFSYEKAWLTARMSREEHEALLKEKYVHRNCYGAMSEAEVRVEDLRREPDFLPQVALNSPWQYMVLSQFMSRLDEAELMKEFSCSLSHQRKTDEPETQKQRLDRYRTEVVDHATGATRSVNSLIEQKMWRQKYGHLFEILSDDYFSTKAARLSSEAASTLSDTTEFPTSFAPGSVYFPANPEKIVTQSKDFVKALNSFLPFPSKVFEARLAAASDGSERLEMDFYLGEIFSEKLEQWVKTKPGFEMRCEEEHFSDFVLSGEVDASLLTRKKVSLILPATPEALNEIATSKRAETFPAAKKREATTGSLESGASASALR